MSFKAFGHFIFN